MICFLLRPSSRQCPWGFPWSSVAMNPPVNEETPVWSLLQKDPTSLGEDKPVPRNYWAYVLEPRNHNCWSPNALESMPHNKRSYHSEKAVRCGYRAAPLTATTEKPAQQQSPSTATDKQIHKKTVPLSLPAITIHITYIKAFNFPHSKSYTTF